VFAAAVLLSCTGCAYVQNRGNDLLDVVDVGVTVSKEPGVAVYAGFLNILSLGYSDVDGVLLGTGGRHVGAVDFRQNAGGLLLWGYEQFGYEDFDADDSDSPPPWGVAVAGRGRRPPRGQIINCPKMVHLGWIGLTLNCKFGELADLLLGLTTFDFMGDDHAGEAADQPPAGP
jgi:hypothetical protein